MNQEDIDMLDPADPPLCGAVMATCRNEPGHPGEHWHPDVATRGAVDPGDGNHRELPSGGLALAASTSRLDPADPPSPLTSHVGYHVNGWRNDCPACVMQDAGSLGHNLAVPRLGHSGDFADCPQALCVRVRAGLASPPAPAGLDEIMDRIEDLPTWRYAGERKVSREAVLNILRAATRPAEDGEK